MVVKKQLTLNTSLDRLHKKVINVNCCKKVVKFNYAQGYS